ncbi:MAG: nucleotidyltransferase domain-containing protein [Sulfurimonadaceae bacterium]|nr:nucleotidyltransferase domain-containing protein [Candidatus Cloacimonadota bacterium]
MRLTIFEIQSILETFHKVFQSGKVYLFGSRLDDNQKGGDIDLYLDVENNNNLNSKKINFLTQLEQKIGEQKIDVVFKKDSSRPIEKEAQKGVELNLQVIKLEKYFEQCDNHIQRMEAAYANVKKVLPLSHHQYAKLDDEMVKNIDQFLFRFSKLQDTIGDKIFKTILFQYNPEFEKLTFIDFLHELEKKEILVSANDWQILRKARNNIAHQYDDEPEEMSQAINEIFAQFDTIKEIFFNLKNKYYMGNIK